MVARFELPAITIGDLSFRFSHLHRQQSSGHVWELHALGLGFGGSQNR